MRTKRKFEDCRCCKFRRKTQEHAEICDLCDNGEMFEDAGVQPLCFDDGRIYSPPHDEFSDEDDDYTRFIPKHDLEDFEDEEELDDEE